MKTSCNLATIFVEPFEHLFLFILCCSANQLDQIFVVFKHDYAFSEFKGQSSTILASSVHICQYTLIKRPI